MHSLIDHPELVVLDGQHGSGHVSFHISLEIPVDVVARVLVECSARVGDHLVDLGVGDGRVVFRRTGAVVLDRLVGVDHRAGGFTECELMVAASGDGRAGVDDLDGGVDADFFQIGDDPLAFAHVRVAEFLHEHRGGEPVRISGLGKQLASALRIVGPEFRQLVLGERGGGDVRTQ